MAEFSYVTWGGFNPVNAPRLRKMSENDQYLKDLADAIPAGPLGFSISEDDVTSEEGVAEYLTDMNITMTNEANRIIKVSFRSKGVKSQNSASALLGLEIDGSTVATSILGIVKNVASGPFNLTYLFSPSAGSHTYKIYGKNLNNTTSDVVFRATPTSPRQLLIEDIGAYIAPDSGG